MRFKTQSRVCFTSDINMTYSNNTFFTADKRLRYICNKLDLGHYQIDVDYSTVSNFTTRVYSSRISQAVRFEV